MIESFNHKRDLLGHKRYKQRSMKLSFRSCQTCRDRDHLESIMDKRIELVGHTVAGHMVGTCWIEMTQSKMEYSWIHLIDEEMDMGFHLVLVHIGIMVIIAIILTRGVTWDIFWMSLRKQRNLHLMEK